MTAPRGSGIGKGIGSNPKCPIGCLCAKHVSRKCLPACECPKHLKGSLNPAFKHGYVNTRIYKIWAGMLTRCSNLREQSFPYYGGRGITVCENWRLSFPAFLADMGHPKIGESIDRIDNDGNYEPGNCRWANASQQQRNKSNNRLLTAFGETKTLIAWSEDRRCTHKSESTIRSRLKEGVHIEDALMFPATRNRNRSSLYHLAFDELKTLREWIADPRCTVNLTTLSKRVCDGWKIQDALTSPPKKDHRRKS